MSDRVEFALTRRDLTLLVLHQALRWHTLKLSLVPALLLALLGSAGMGFVGFLLVFVGIFALNATTTTLVMLLGASRSLSHGTLGTTQLQLRSDGYRLDAPRLSVFQRWSSVGEIESS